MADYEALKDKVQELAERVWDDQGIEARFRKLAQEGIPGKIHNRDEIISHKHEILDRVQRLGEEYEYHI